MKIININPVGAVFVAALGMLEVPAGGEVDVSDEVAAELLIQTANWTLPEDAPQEAADFAADLIAGHEADLIEASRAGVTVTPTDPEPTIETPGEGGQL